MNRSRLVAVSFLLAVAAGGLGIFGAWYGPHEGTRCGTASMSDSIVFGSPPRDCSRDAGTPYYIVAAGAGTLALAGFLAAFVIQPATPPSD